LGIDSKSLGFVEIIHVNGGFDDSYDMHFSTLLAKSLFGMDTESFVLGRQPDAQIDYGRGLLLCLQFLPAPITNNLALNLHGMLFAARPEAMVAFSIKPGVPIFWINLQDRLEFCAAPTDAAFDEGHGKFPLHLHQKPHVLMAF
jgi:hypothetical protein